MIPGIDRQTIPPLARPLATTTTATTTSSTTARHKHCRSHLASLVKTGEECEKSWFLLQTVLCLVSLLQRSRPLPSS